MDLLDKIKKSNSSIGLKTHFYSENNDILGYTEGNTIFLNTNYIDDIELANKHEVMHHFTDTKQFKTIKELIFSIISDDTLKNIRAYYELKYKDIYQDSTFLDDEIAIDFIIGNCPFNIDINEYIKDAYGFITSQKTNITVANKTKKYLNITMSKKIDQQFSKLTKWEKFFVLNYYNGKDRLMPYNKETKYDEVRKDINKELNRLYDYAKNEENFMLDPDNKEIKRRVDVQIRNLLREEKVFEANRIMENYDEYREKLAKSMSKTLFREYEKIIYILKTSDYDNAFKYLMLEETLSRFYKKEIINGSSNAIVGKRIQYLTPNNHMVLNEVTLDVIYNLVNNYSSFSDLYFDSLDYFNKVVNNQNKIQLDSVDTYGMGIWMHFPSKENDPEHFIENSQKLTALVKDTIWCTKNQATAHLELGDYYIFVDDYDRPHIAVRMIGNTINEVRGIANFFTQEIEPEYRKVAVSFLTNNVNLKHGIQWLRKEEWTKRISDYIQKLKTNTLKDEEIDRLIFDITEANDYKINMSRNRSKMELILLIKDNEKIVNRIAEIFRCSKEEICFRSISSLDKFGDVFPYVVVMGTMCFSGENKNTDYSKLKYVFGNLHIMSSDYNGLLNLEVIGEDARISSSKIKALPKLRKIGNRLDLRNNKFLKSLPSLISIGGDANFNGAVIESLPSLEFIGGNADFTDTNIIDISSLKSVDGEIYSDNDVLNSFVKNKDKNSR